MRHQAVAMINGHILPREVWRVVRPKAGTLVEIRVVPHGSGLLRIILTLVVIAAVITLAPYLAPMLGVELATAGAMLFGSARAGLPDLPRFMDEDPAWKGLERLYTGGAEDLSVHEERREVAGEFSAQRARYEFARDLAKKAFADEKWDEADTHWVTAAGEAGGSRTCP